MKTQLIIILIITASLFSCKKSEDTIRMKCGETFCSQYWSSENKREVKQKLKEYFTRKDVKLYDVVITGERVKPYGDCYCPTGREIEILIGMEDKDVAEKAGFR